MPKGEDTASLWGSARGEQEMLSYPLLARRCARLSNQGGEHVISEAQSRAQKRYMRKIKQYIVKVNMETEADIIAAIESQPNKAGYIKHLIRKDIRDD